MNEIDLLLDAYFDGDLAPAEAARLDAWLAENEHHREILVQRSVEHLLLRDALQAEADAASGEVDGSGPIVTLAAKAMRPTPFSMTVAAIVLGIVICTMALVTPPFYRAMRGVANSEDGPLFVAQVTGLHEVAWEKEQAGVAQGAHLQAGQRVEVKRGLVEITFRSGAAMLIEGPVAVVLDPDRKPGGAMLLRGRLTAHVPPEAIGFSIRAHNLRVVDLGTEFGVQTEGEKSTAVEVFQGSVRVEQNGPSAGAGKPLTLVAGERASFGSAGETQQKSDARETFVRQLPFRKPGWLIGYEGFDYPSGMAIDAAVGGNGWERGTREASDWQISSGAGGKIESKMLVTSDSSAVRRYGGLSRGKGTDEAPTDERLAAVRAKGALYFGVTLRLKGSPRWAGISSLDFEDERVFFGKRTDQPTFGVADYVSAASLDSEVAADADKSYRLVGVLDYQLHEARLWVNPDDADFDRGLGDHSADAVSAMDSGKWSTAVRLGSGPGGEAIWDDLIVTTSFLRACQGRDALLSKPAGAAPPKKE